jgi:hypothetical protein
MSHPSHLILIACAPMWIGCATIVHGTTQKIRIESNPAAATAHIGAQTVLTPSEVSLSRDGSYDVEIEKAGYISARSHIGQTTSGVVWANLLLGGVIGMIVDASTGAAYDLDPSTVSVTLLPDPNAHQEAGRIGATNP